MRCSGCLFIELTNMSLFMIQRSICVPSPCVWSIPGGKAETNDMYKEALREVNEEIGFIPNHQVADSFVYTGKNISYTTFVCFTYNIFTPILNYESSDFGWFGSTLPNPLHPGLVWLLNQI